MVSEQIASVRSDREQDILQALFELRAFDRRSRKTTADVIKKALGPEANPDSYKELIASPKHENVIETLSGRNGGCWLTKVGRTEAEKIVSS